LRFLNEAERTGTTPELATAYSSLAVLVGYAQLHNLAESYVARGLDVARKVNEPSNIITVNVVTSVYKITVGKWDEVQTRATEAKVLCEQLGDYRQWGDSMDILAESALIAGDIEYARNVEMMLLEDARRRRNPLQQLWGLFGYSAISIRCGEEAKAIPMLEEALQILEELPNFASSVNTNAQLALAHLRLGHEEIALAFAARVLELSADRSPTVYSLDIGFSAVAQVYFELWEHALRNPNEPSNLEQFKALAAKAIKLLRTFKNIFPIGQAYLAYYEGWEHWLMGRTPMAIWSWKRGLDAARKFNVLYEEGLLRLRLGEALKDSPDEQHEHLECAIQIFEKMGAVHDLQLARAKATENGFPIE
jgi:tetratricopeptide (TPR) repeat protein